MGRGERPRPASGRGEILPISVLSFAWIVAALLTHPAGDFPLNDDWAYGLAVRALVEDGALRFTHWQSVPLISQVLWGALFCLPAGFSFTALRISTLTLGLLGVLGLYATLRYFSVSRCAAFFGAAVLLSNPIYFGLSHTFMTDVPFVAAMIGSVFFLFRGFDLNRGQGHGRDLVIGYALALLATLDRQLGLSIPLAFAIALAFRRDATGRSLFLSRRWALSAVLPMILIGGALFGYERIIDATQGLPRLYVAKNAELRAPILDLLHLHLGALRNPMTRSFMLLMYIGLFTSPFLLVLSTSRPRLGRSAAPFVLALLATVALAKTNWLMPMTGNVLLDVGMGPRTLEADLPRAPAGVWLGLTFLSAVGTLLFGASAICAARIARTGGRTPEEQTSVAPWHLWVLLLVAAISFGPPALVYSGFFDRYLIVYVPLAVVALAPLSAQFAGDAPPEHGSRTEHLLSLTRMSVASAMILGAFLFGISATHDYLAWNRARWALAADVQRSLGISRTEIDGGLEFNNYDPAVKTRAAEGEPAWITRPSARYTLSLSKTEGHEVIARHSFATWLPLSATEIFMLRRPLP